MTSKAHYSSEDFEYDSSTSCYFFQIYFAMLTGQIYFLFDRFLSEYKFDVSKLEPLVAKVSSISLTDLFQLTEKIIAIDKVTKQCC